LLMLGPHLTEANFAEVMLRAKHRTKREIARLVRVLDPLPAVPACIEPLGPAPASPARVVPNASQWKRSSKRFVPCANSSPAIVRAIGRTLQPISETVRAPATRRRAARRRATRG